MKQHPVHKIEFVNFPISKRIIRGVYMIEDYYVGASKNVRSRIVSHINNTFSGIRIYGKLYDIISEKIYETYQTKGYLTVTFLSHDTNEESIYYDIYKPKCNDPIRGRWYNQRFKNK